MGPLERIFDAGVTSAKPSLHGWRTAHSLAMLAAALVSVLSKNPMIVPSVGILSFVALWVGRRRALAEIKPYGGLANLVTALRVGIVSCAGFFMLALSPLWVAALFVVNAALDSIDGFLARRKAQSTKFGAIFDEEADALFVLIAYSYFHIDRGFPAWILIPGMLPYLYRLVFLRRRDNRSPRQRFAAWLAGVNFILLPVAVVLPEQWLTGALLISVGIVGFSFFVSFWRFQIYARTFSGDKHFERNN